MRKRPILITILLLFAALFAWMLFGRIGGGSPVERPGRRPAPVDVAEVVRGSIRQARVFSGSLETQAELIVSPKVAGRIEELTVNLGDRVKRDQVVAVLDDDEFVQAVAQAEAELAVAQANLTEAGSTLEIADREFERTQTLRQRGVASESEMDTARTRRLAAAARLEVARAEVQRAESAVQSERIRLGYTRVRANWSGGDDERVVAERYIDEGQTLAANTRLMRIVELDPLIGVIFVTEKDYGLLSLGQEVSISTDAWPGETFAGKVERISPVFSQNARQARIELLLANPGHMLKPGMFIRANVILRTVDDATIVPEAALTNRGGQYGVFAVSQDRSTVHWRPVEIGVREGRRVQVTGEGIGGLVVTLGQQLVEDGSAVTIPEAGADGEGAPSR